MIAPMTETKNREEDLKEEVGRLWTLFANKKMIIPPCVLEEINRKEFEKEIK